MKALILLSSVKADDLGWWEINANGADDKYDYEIELR